MPVLLLHAKQFSAMLQCWNYYRVAQRVYQRGDCRSKSATIPGPRQQPKAQTALTQPMNESIRDISAPRVNERCITRRAFCGATA